MPLELVGHVTWQGRPPQPHPLQQLPITLTLRSGTTEVNYPSRTTDPNGVFTVTITDLPAGTYAWRVKGPKFLANAGTATVPSTEYRVPSGVVRDAVPRTRHSVLGTTIEMGLMRTGDANNDNRIDVSDFAILRGTFGKAQGDPGYDDRADFNGDNAVNTTDFSLLRTNFGQGGAPPIGPNRNGGNPGGKS